MSGPVKLVAQASGLPLQAPWPRRLAALPVQVYRATLSAWLGGHCRFQPSCSEYALEAIRVHGVIRGWGLSAWRVLRCQPFGAGGCDPVPASKVKGPRPGASCPEALRPGGRFAAHG